MTLRVPLLLCDKGFPTYLIHTLYDRGFHGFRCSHVGQAVHNIREVRGFGAEPRELVRFQAAARNSSAKSKQIGASAGRLEALNRVVINVW